ncbi:MAG: hypothetical protein RRY33_08560, partial [Alistipes sp.]
LFAFLLMSAVIRAAAVTINFASLVFLLLAGHSEKAPSAPVSCVGCRTHSDCYGVSGGFYLWDIEEKKMAKIGR